MNAKHDHSWVNPFDPYSYMEQWLEDHPECLASLVKQYTKTPKKYPRSEASRQKEIERKRRKRAEKREEDQRNVQR